MVVMGENRSKYEQVERKKKKKKGRGEIRIRKESKPIPDQFQTIIKMNILPKKEDKGPKPH